MWLRGAYVSYRGRSSLGLLLVHFRTLLDDGVTQDACMWLTAAACVTGKGAHGHCRASGAGQ